MPTRIRRCATLPLASLTAVLLGIGFAPASVAAAAEQSALPQSLRACRLRTDTLERLHCFDTESARLDVPATPKLGQEQIERRKPSPTPPADTADSSLTARLVKVESQRPGLRLFTLDNGQRWRQLETDDYFPAVAGDTVRIEPGALGSYRLTRVAEGWNKWLRVRRID
jgi:hypothetical protein